MSVIARMRRSEFLAHVATLLSGSFAARLLAIALAPIITRLFSPEDFGVAALFIALCSVASTISSLRYDHAIVLPELEREAMALFNVSVLVLGPFCVLLGLFMYVAGELSPDTAWMQHLGPWIYFLPFVTFVAGFANVVFGVALRRCEFRRIAKSDFLDALSTGLTRISSGMIAGSSVPGLLFGYLVGTLVRVTMLSANARTYFHGLMKMLRGRRALCVVARRYSDFPRHSVPTGLLRAGYQQMPVLLLPFLFSPAVVGFYALSARLVKMPVVTLSNAFRRVFLQRVASRINKRQPFRPFYIKVTALLLLLAVILAVPLLLLSGDIFAFAFGESWRTAGDYTGVLSPWFLSMFVQAPSAAVFVALKKQAISTRFNFVALALGAAVFIAAGLLVISPVVTLAMFAVVGVAVNLVSIGLADWLVRRYERGTLQVS